LLSSNKFANLSHKQIIRSGVEDLKEMIGGKLVGKRVACLGGVCVEEDLEEDPEETVVWFSVQSELVVF
jgi:hypothetical protein